MRRTLTVHRTLPDTHTGRKSRAEQYWSTPHFANHAINPRPSTSKGMSGRSRHSTSAIRANQNTPLAGSGLMNVPPACRVAPRQCQVPGPWADGEVLVEESKKCMGRSMIRCGDEGVDGNLPDAGRGNELREGVSGSSQPQGGIERWRIKVNGDNGLRRGGANSAERKGFEPLVGFYPYAALAKPCFRPLSHLSYLENLSSEVAEWQHDPFFGCLSGVSYTEVDFPIESSYPDP